LATSSFALPSSCTSTPGALALGEVEGDCEGGTLNKQADSFVVYSGAPTTTVTGLSHLEGESVDVWADGADVGQHTVSGGTITLTTAASNVVAGLHYTGRFESVPKLFGAHGMLQRAIVHHVALMLYQTHAQGLRYGQDFDRLDDLPLIYQGATVDGDTVHALYTGDAVTLPGQWGPDTRICLEAASPRPCTILCAVFAGVSHDKA
jgi:hypothetical protein